MRRLARVAKRAYASDYFPYFVLLVTMAVLHCFIGLGQGDDGFFSGALDRQGIADYLQLRYSRWTSRILIEAVMVTVLRSALLWRVLDVAALLTLALSLSRLIGARRSRTMNYLVCLGFMIYPFAYLSSAGWGATTVNYLWPGAACAFALIPYKKAVEGERVGAKLGAVALAATVFAANAEQFAFFLVCLMAALNACFIRRGKTQPVLLPQFFAAAAMAVFALTCPGNANRIAEETARWFPGFGMLGFLDRAYLGAAQTVAYIFATPNRLFLLFGGAVFVSVWRKHESVTVRCVAALPFVYSVFANVPANLYRGVLPELQRLTTFGLPSGAEALSATRYAVMFIAMLSLCFAGISLINVYGKTKKGALFVFLLLIGLAAGAMTGFLPTAYASGLRTYFITDMVFLFLGCSLVKDLLPGLAPVPRRLLLAAVAALAALSLHQTFLVITA